MGSWLKSSFRENTILVIYLLLSPTKSTFSLGKNFGGTRHLCEKNEPTNDGLGGCTVRPAGS